MKTKLLSFFLLFYFISSSLSSFSQQKWSVGLEITPNLSKTLFKQSDLRFTVIPAVNLEASFHAGFSSKFKINRHFNEKSILTIGLGTLTASEKLTTQLVYTDRTESSFRINRYNSFQLSLSHSRYFSPKFFFNYGASLLFIHTNSTGNKNEKAKLFIPNTERFGYTNWDRFNATVQLGIGYDLIKNENYTLYIQPSVEKMVFNLYYNTDSYLRSMMFGISIGCRF